MSYLPLTLLIDLTLYLLAARPSNVLPTTDITYRPDPLPATDGSQILLSPKVPVASSTVLSAFLFVFYEQKRALQFLNYQMF